MYRDTNPSDNGSDGNLYCVNGNIGGLSGSGVAGTCYCRCNIGFGDPNCATCAAGYSGTTCAADDCVATSTPTDDGSDGNFYCVNGGSLGGTTGFCTCTSCDTGFTGDSCESQFVQVSSMTELTNRVDYTGSSILENGMTALLSVKLYNCSAPSAICNHYDAMLKTSNLNGYVRCTEDDASCIIDGEATRKGMWVKGNLYGNKLTIRALTFQNCFSAHGGAGVELASGVCDLVLCHFQNNVAGYGAGIAIYQITVTFNLFGTSFTNNIANSADCNDISNIGGLGAYGTINIHSTCPSPHYSHPPIKGKSRKSSVQPLPKWTSQTSNLQLASKPLKFHQDRAVLSFEGSVFGPPHSFYCVSCPSGYSGNFPNCVPELCLATSTLTDDGSISSQAKFYCINGGEIGGSVGSCSCTSCNTGFDGVNCANPHHVDDMEGLFNTISNAKGDVSIEHAETGNYIMANNDTVILAVRAYRCSEGICAKGYDNYMLYTEDLHGEMKCVQDYASCVLDGESANKGMTLIGTGDAKFTVRAISFFNGVGTNFGGGGMAISGGAVVDLILCHFTNCNSKHATLGGGAILVLGVETTVNTFGVSFLDNEATISAGNDIMNHPNDPGSITLHETCPPPYQSNNPTQGKFTKIFYEALRY